MRGAHRTCACLPPTWRSAARPSPWSGRMHWRRFPTASSPLPPLSSTANPGAWSPAATAPACCTLPCPPRQTRPRHAARVSSRLCLRHSAVGADAAAGSTSCRGTSSNATAPTATGGLARARVPRPLTARGSRGSASRRRLRQQLWRRRRQNPRGGAPLTTAPPLVTSWTWPARPLPLRAAAPPAAARRRRRPRPRPPPTRRQWRAAQRASMSSSSPL
ncbi:MAG: hypothetical protein J3K34DRAFT_417816 [Monoraphidium minutum]|nr:MAG: hypothetical protein J3K34DRAFT_417816 [Monoraphidium minutum]